MLIIALSRGVKSRGNNHSGETTARPRTRKHAVFHLSILTLTPRQRPLILKVLIWLRIKTPRRLPQTCAHIHVLQFGPRCHGHVITANIPYHAAEAGRDVVFSVVRNIPTRAKETSSQRINLLTCKSDE